MSTGVFANGLEISCKSSSGKSPASFPDPCFSPPSPSAGWIVIPYANTAKASTATNTSKTVYIKGKPVMLKDKSYFKTSTGDEGAAGPKGVSTGTKKGKAYYRSWSSDVKIEGYNVCRHTDQMTHNHNPVQGNTGTWHYVSSGKSGKCKDEIEKVDDECEVSERDQRKFIERQADRNSRRKGRRRSNGTPKPDYGLRPKTWKDEHCKGLLFKPRLHELQQHLEKLEMDAKELYEDMAGEAWSAVQDRAIDKAVDYGERTIVKHVAGSAGAVVTTIWTGPGVGFAVAVVNGIIFITDVIDAIFSIVSLPFNLYNAYDDVNEVRKIVENIPDMLQAINDPEQQEKLKEELIEQAKEAAEDDCIQARKCMLVPYHKSCKESDSAKGVSQNSDPKSVTVGRLRATEKKSGGNFFQQIGMGHSGGCCPGQTGHHLIPGSWAEKACPGYENKSTGNGHKCAPVVCVEGVGQYDGTHGDVHASLDSLLNKKLAARTQAGITDKSFDLSEIITMAYESHLEQHDHLGDCSFCIRKYPCEKECMEEQLNNAKAYESCGKFTPEPIQQSTENTSGGDSGE